MKNQFSQPFADHFLQQEIVSRLATATGPLSFSQLKEDGIENSLFMYHANKLISRGVVEKANNGFQLTKTGARWVNVVGLSSRYPKILPRPLIQLVVQDGVGNLLLASRQGQLGIHLTPYMLPGKLHEAGLFAGEAALQMARIFFGDHAPQPTPLTIVEVIHEYQDGARHHVLAHIFSLQVVPGQLPPEDEHFNYEWVAIADIAQGDERFDVDDFLSQFVRKLGDSAILPSMYFRIHE